MKKHHKHASAPFEHVSGCNMWRNSLGLHFHAPRIPFPFIAVIVVAFMDFIALTAFVAFIATLPAGPDGFFATLTFALQFSWLPLLRLPLLSWRLSPLLFPFASRAPSASQLAQGAQSLHRGDHTAAGSRI